MHALCLLALGAVAGACATPPARPVRAGTHGPVTSAAVSALAHWREQWSHLRAQRGHFDGAPWNDAVDRWNGPKHRLMRAMGAYLLAERADAAAVMALLGPADAATAAATPGAAPEVAVQWQPADPAAAPPRRYWWYRWRGNHDRMVLALGPDAEVVGLGWALAGE